MADLTKQTLVENDGTVVTYAAAATGDTIANFDVRDELIVKNGGASPINVTLSSYQLCNQGSDHDLIKAVTASGEFHFRLAPAARWQNATSKKLEIAYSALTSVTVAAVRHPR
jgi:hypothetical protein